MLADEPKHIVVDSTGLKVYGEGEWKVRQHGYSKRRTWRKLHLSVDENTHELQALVLTEASVDDAKAGNMETAKKSRCPVTKICDAFARLDGRNGRSNRAIIDAHWQKRLSFASRLFSETH